MYVFLVIKEGTFSFSTLLCIKFKLLIYTEIAKLVNIISSPEPKAHR